MNTSTTLTQIGAYLTLGCHETFNLFKENDEMKDLIIYI